MEIFQPVSPLNGNGALNLPPVSGVSPVNGAMQLYHSRKANAGYLEVLLMNGRDFPLQPHFGYNRIATWAPASTSTISTMGLSVQSVGTISTPTISNANFASSVRRWRVTSVSSTGSIASNRGNGPACFVGGDTVPGGFRYTVRFSFNALATSGSAYFGLRSATVAPVSGHVASTYTNSIGFGYSPGDPNFSLYISNSSTLTQSGLGSNFPVDTASVYTVTINNQSYNPEIGMRIVNDTNGRIFETNFASGVGPNAGTSLSPFLFQTNFTDAGAISYDCAGVYLETDY